ncbi:MAG: DUF1232 domain-containing protein [Candidatus Hydrogenedentes bacterium]|nr:DUF1232 domain-containing protein [Candidatus Hydrogenedentota bacterium]
MSRSVKSRVVEVVRGSRNEVAVYQSVIADPRCPRAARWLLIAAVAYALSPIDFIPDFVPVLGHLDDILVLPPLIWLSLRMISAELVAEHRAKIMGRDTTSVNSTRANSGAL